MPRRDPKAKRRPGKRSKYNASLSPKLAFFLARKGATLAEMGQELGVSIRTVENWMDQHPEFKEAIQRGKSSDVEAVESALLKLALGFTFTEEKIVGNQPENREIIKIQKYLPPNVNAIRFYLTNRKPEDWKEKQEIVATIANIEIEPPAPPEEKEPIIVEGKTITDES